MALDTPLTVSAVIPTFGRHEVLVATIAALRALERPPDEIVVVDQNPSHPPAVEAQLAAWDRSGAIRRERRRVPSIPAAMNAGLVSAAGEIVLYFDDDIEPAVGLVAAHAAAHELWTGGIVAGQVLQPGESPAPLDGPRFAFRSSIGQEISDFMGGNFSIRRTLALSIGGFDENFVGAGYRIESDLAARALAAGARIRFEPTASIHHLRAERGGARARGDHLETARPHHAVGEYYYLLRHRPPAWWRRLLTRPLRAAMTRHHLRRPWWVPATLCAELGGLGWGAWLALRGPKMGVPPAQRGEEDGA